jgi:hypothetical protein
MEVLRTGARSIWHWSERESSSMPLTVRTLRRGGHSIGMPCWVCDRFVYYRMLWRTTTKVSTKRRVVSELAVLTSDNAT